MQKCVTFVKKTFEDKHAKEKNYSEIRGHYYHTGEQ